MEETKKENKEEKKEEKKKHEHEIELKHKKTVHHQHHSQKSSQFKLKKTSMWQAISALLVIALVVTMTTGKCADTEDEISVEAAGEKTVSFINTVLLDQSTEAQIKTVSEQNDLYKVEFTVQGKDYPSFISKDGKLLFLQEAIEIEKVLLEAGNQPTQPTAPTAPVDAVKAEKPVVELFVMSHCPYGTQIEKGMLPVAELLGDKIDFSVKFVDYAMHGKTELDEETLQHCIQRDYPEKYADYLTCFLGAGNTAECIASGNLDKVALDECVAEVDEEFGITAGFEDQSTWNGGRFPQYNVYKDLNTKYGVQGSPHLVINGESVSSGRDSASLLKAVCDRFIESPEECTTQLSSASPSPGFGFSETAGATTASCG